MENPKAPDQKPQLSKGQRMEALDGLMKQYGGSGRIPDEDLTKIGYVRQRSEDGLVRFLFAERVEDLAKREVKGPFERISLELPTADQSFRFIPRSQQVALSEKLKAAEWAFYPNWDGGRAVSGWDEGGTPEVPDPPQAQNMRLFFVDYLGFIDKQHKGKLSKKAITELFAKPLPVRVDEDAISDTHFGHQIFLRDFRDDDGSIGTLKSRDMYDELTRLEGFFGDVPELTRIFEQRLSEPVTNSDKSEVNQTEQEYLGSLGISNFSDFVRRTFPGYLESIGLSQMADQIAKTPELSSVSSELKNLDGADPYLQEEKRLRALIKAGSIEEKKELSGKLKEVDAVRKKRLQVKKGVEEYFDSPQVTSDISQMRVKEVKEYLVSGKVHPGDTATYTLDATPNPELDKNPGKVSGDCTEGRPLPFNRPEIPVYNVKVFNPSKKHIGNIYLLETYEADEYDEAGKNTLDSSKNNIWHLDAIQVPASGIEWDKAISVIIDGLARAGEAKGVRAITVNEGGTEDDDDFHNPLISNYDYIQKAVLNHWESKRRHQTEVHMPTFSNEDGHYSGLQGSGSALILWYKEPYQEA